MTVELVSSSIVGSLILIGVAAPIIFFALLMAFGAWNTALVAVSQFFVAVPMSSEFGEFPAEASLLTLVTLASVVASIRARIITY